MRRLGLLLLLAGCGTYTPLDSHYNRGVEFYDQGRLADAIREYKLALDDEPEHYRARYNLAVCHHDQGKLDDAAREYEEVLRLRPDNARALVAIASIRSEQGREADALELLARAAAADPDAGFPRSALARHWEKKDPDKALAEYRESVRIEPGHAPGHAGIARLLASRGDLEGAGAEYAKALAADGDDVASLIGSSEIREKTGDARGAMLHLERALVHVNGRADLWLRLAGLYEKQDRLEDAVSALWQVRSIEPAHAAAASRLKALYARLASRDP